jgi:hypothetical protein
VALEHTLSALDGDGAFELLALSLERRELEPRRVALHKEEVDADVLSETNLVASAVAESEREVIAVKVAPPVTDTDDVRGALNVGTALTSDDGVALTVAEEEICKDEVSRGDTDEEHDREERAEADVVVECDAESVYSLDSCGELDMLTLRGADAEGDAERSCVEDDCDEPVGKLALADALLLMREDPLGDLLVDTEPLAELQSDVRPVVDGEFPELTLTRALPLLLCDAVSNVEPLELPDSEFCRVGAAEEVLLRHARAVTDADPVRV